MNLGARLQNPAIYALLFCVILQSIPGIALADIRPIEYGIVPTSIPHDGYLQAISRLHYYKPIGNGKTKLKKTSIATIIHQKGCRLLILTPAHGIFEEGYKQRLKAPIRNFVLKYMTSSSSFEKVQIEDYFAPKDYDGRYDAFDLSRETDYAFLIGRKNNCSNTYAKIALRGFIEDDINNLHMLSLHWDLSGLRVQKCQGDRRENILSVYRTPNYSTGNQSIYLHNCFTQDGVSGGVIVTKRKNGNYIVVGMNLGISNGYGVFKKLDNEFMQFMFDIGNSKL